MVLIYCYRLINNKAQMKHKKLDQNGFIPMLLSILAVVLLIIYFAYTRVLHATH